MLSPSLSDHLHDEFPTSNASEFIHIVCELNSPGVHSMLPIPDLGTDEKISDPCLLSTR